MPNKPYKQIKKKCKHCLIEYSTMPSKVGFYEKPILDNLEECFDYKILRQFKIGGYFVDGYCYELNLVIEIDEPGHKYKKERDIERQDFIQSELSCKFLRIPVEEI